MTVRRPTVLEQAYPDTPEFISVAAAILNIQLSTMLNALWAGYDLLKADLVTLGPYELGDEMERVLTQWLQPYVRNSLSGEEPFDCMHSPREPETRLEPPAMSPEYDMGFVFKHNKRVCWPVEAKVLRSDGAIAEYLADVKGQFLTCRYAPFVNSGAMVAYLLRGDPDKLFTNIATALRTPLLPVGDRDHMVSEHTRTVPDGKPYPSDFACHHLVMPIRFP